MNVRIFIKELYKETLSTAILMFRIMLPVSIVVKILQETGAIVYIGYALSPFMKIVGLPGEMGLVWATTMITNLFGGTLAFLNIAPYFHLSVAQTTVLCLMMLIAHTFPIELQITKKAGVKLVTMFIIRFGFAFLIGIILNQIYSVLDVLQEPSVITWKKNVVIDTSLRSWAIGELKNYGVIISFIFSLLLLMKILKLTGVINIITKALSPLLRMLGIGVQVTTIAIIGLILGVVYGGVLIINESKSKDINKRDVFYCLVLMGLCHSIIEDTILMLALGSHFSGIFITRVILSFMIIWLIVKFTKRMSDKSFKKYFLTSK